MDPLTGACIYGPKIQLAAQRLQEAIQAAAEGTFQPDRERDELTYALGNPEHPGRTRGKGMVPWSMGSGITLNHIEASKEERMMSWSTCEG